MTIEADGGHLVRKISHRIEAIGDVVPRVGLIECGVDYGEVVNLAHHTEAGEPSALIWRELVSSPA